MRQETTPHTNHVPRSSKRSRSFSPSLMPRLTARGPAFHSEANYGLFHLCSFDFHDRRHDIKSLFHGANMRQCAPASWRTMRSQRPSWSCRTSRQVKSRAPRTEGFLPDQASGDWRSYPALEVRCNSATTRPLCRRAIDLVSPSGD